MKKSGHRKEKENGSFVSLIPVEMGSRLGSLGFKWYQGQEVVRDPSDGE